MKGGQTRAGIAIENENSILDVTCLAEYGSQPSKLGTVKNVDDILANNLLEELKSIYEGASSFPSCALPLSAVSLQSPILKPQKIICAAVNYSSHGKEAKVNPLTVPYFFSKFASSIIGPYDSIVIPKSSKKVDWEAELAVVIGKKGKYIPRSEAMDYVAGYTIANDISFRDLLFHEGLAKKPDTLGPNWMMGKALDSSLPLGPWLVTKDEMPYPLNYKIQLSVNGELRQDSSTKEMLFEVDQLIEFVSDGITLLPGDVISTGTPGGTAYFTGAPYLTEGDVVETTIERVGKIVNRVVLQ